MQQSRVIDGKNLAPAPRGKHGFSCGAQPTTNDGNIAGKYVNMADIKLHGSLSDSDGAALVEMLFFAYRDFVADADDMLASQGFGRAHHRVLHFVGRGPGMTVAQLLDILRITKQSLSRVLKDLIAKGYVYQKEGPEDRRQRLLYLTPDGEALWRRLINPQIGRFRDAVRQLGEKDGQLYRELLLHIVSSENRDAVQQWIARADSQVRPG
jgi:DNA-binding MarR family transcriptional regulator